MDRKLTETMLCALERAAFFMDVAIPLNDGWEDAFHEDLVQVRSATREGRDALMSFSVA